MKKIINLKEYKENTKEKVRGVIGVGVFLDRTIQIITKAFKEDVSHKDIYKELLSNIFELSTAIDFYVFQTTKKEFAKIKNKLKGVQDDELEDVLNDIQNSNEVDVYSFSSYNNKKK